MANRSANGGEPRFNGNVIIGELMRNMELGQFEMAYTVLLPCIFTVYLNPEDHSSLSGVFDLIAEDGRRALRSRVSELNVQPTLLGIPRGGKGRKEYKIACTDWAIEFLSHPEVPRGDVEIHSELNEIVQPGFRGTKTTLLGREPNATGPSSAPAAPRTGAGETRRTADPVFAEIKYEDDSGHQTYMVTQNRVRVGRGGDGQMMDVALYTTDEVSREHLVIRRDAATGVFFITDLSKNGTWVSGKRLKRGAEELLPSPASIGVGEILTLDFQARK